MPGRQDLFARRILIPRAGAPISFGTSTRAFFGQEAGIRTRTVSFTGRDAAVTPQSWFECAVQYSEREIGGPAFALFIPHSTFLTAGVQAIHDGKGVAFMYHFLLCLRRMDWQEFIAAATPFEWIAFHRVETVCAPRG